MNPEYDAYVARGRAKWGEQFSDSDLAPQFREHFRTGQRIRVRTTFDDGTIFDRTGTVGATTGWRPAFLLMHRSNAHGSWDVLSYNDEIIAVQHGRTYVEVT